jgi:hypothetical protein
MEINGTAEPALSILKAHLQLSPTKSLIRDSVALRVSNLELLLFGVAGFLKLWFWLSFSLIAKSV